jgi:hypothetical protein
VSETLRAFWPNDWAAPAWVLPGCLLGGVLIALVLWSWMRGRVSASTGIIGVSLKVLAIVVLILILIEPMRSETRPEPGANLFLILADDSQSLAIRDEGQDKTRAEKLKETLNRLGKSGSVRILTPEGTCSIGESKPCPISPNSPRRAKARLC